MAIVTIGDLRSRFRRVKEAIARDGEVIVTERGRPAYVIRPYVARRRATPQRVDYYERLKARQPRPLSVRASRALDDANRGDH